MSALGEGGTESAPPQSVRRDALVGSIAAWHQRPHAVLAVAVMCCLASGCGSSGSKAGGAVLRLSPDEANAAAVKLAREVTPQVPR
jgi:hypothetical protein